MNLSPEPHPRTTRAIGYRHNLPTRDPSSLIEEVVKIGPMGPHDLLVEVKAVSVNPVDVKVRAGSPTSDLRVLGFDAAGTVLEVGTEVTLFAPGDDVFYAGSIARPGTNQQLHLVDERITGPKPSTLSFADAASMPLTAITAWESLFDRLALNSESVGALLVVGATGGVGSLIVQLARALMPGVKVIATASDEIRGDWVRDLGAHHFVNHRSDLAPQVLSLAPEGVDWIFTAHSAGQIATYATLLRPFGAIVAIDDGPRDVAPLKAKSISWHWELMFTRSLQQTADMIEQHKLLHEIAGLVDAGTVQPTATEVLSPISAETLREAHRRVETGRTVGKVVLEGWAKEMPDRTSRGSH